MYLMLIRIGLFFITETQPHARFRYFRLLYTAPSVHNSVSITIPPLKKIFICTSQNECKAVSVPPATSCQKYNKRAFTLTTTTVTTDCARYYTLNWSRTPFLSKKIYKHRIFMAPKTGFFLLEVISQYWLK